MILTKITKKITTKISSNCVAIAGSPQVSVSIQMLICSAQGLLQRINKDDTAFLGKARLMHKSFDWHHDRSPSCPSQPTI